MDECARENEVIKAINCIKATMSSDEIVVTDEIKKILDDFIEKIKEAVSLETTLVNNTIDSYMTKIKEKEELLERQKNELVSTRDKLEIYKKALDGISLLSNI